MAELALISAVIDQGGQKAVRDNKYRTINDTRTYPQIAPVHSC